jgi:pyroglutamyl-peptidase
MGAVRRILLLAIAALACALTAACGGGDAVPAAQKAPPVVLLTAFEPFGGAPDNPSWEAIKDYEGRTIAGHVVRTARLPVVYDEMAKPLDAAIDAAKPAAVISFGQGRDIIHVERTAKNAYHPRKPPDNAGKPPPRERIVAGGADAIETGLPVDAILKSLHEAKIEAKDSSDAGGYLCNECFYRLVAREGGPKRRGFVHVPRVGAENPLGGTYTLDTLRRAVGIVVEATLTAP